MSRSFSPITVDELKDRIARSRDDNDNKLFTSIVEKDLSKVKFDTENMTNDGYVFGPTSILGYQLLSNKMPYYGVCAGGDWEIPLFFIIYWDGKKLRGYVPEDGNLWNTDTKEAYGNDDTADLKNARKRWPDDEYLKSDDVDLDGYFDNYDCEAIHKDIIKRITLSNPKKSSKVNGALFAYTNDELLSELRRRLEENDNG